MTTARHWTPKSGFFACAARQGNCPKESPHYNAGGTLNGLKSSVRAAELEARTAMLDGDISPDQYKKAVSQVRADAKMQAKELRRIEHDANPKKKFFSTSLTRTAAALTGGAILVGSLTGCGVTVAELPDASKDIKDSHSVSQTLDEADSINLHKSVISFGDNWSVKADEEEVANVKGQVIPILGDTYSMYSNAGNLVGSEAEEVLKGLPGATLYDETNAERGKIDKNLTFLLSKYTVKDENGKTIGTANQNLGLTLNFDIKDAKGQVEYKVSKAAFSFGSSLTVERQVDNPDVSATDAVWITLMANEIQSSKSSSSSKSK